MSQADRHRLIARLVERWPYPTPPDEGSISIFLSEYRRVRAYLALAELSPVRV